MKFRILSYLFLLLLPLAAGVSCTKEGSDDPLREDEDRPLEGIVLDLSATTLEAATRATTTREGEAARNENAIGSTVDVFFFRNAAADAPILKRALQVTVSNNRAAIPTTPVEVRTLFGGVVQGSTCEVLVVTNYSGDYSACTTRADLDALPLETADWGAAPGRFVMTGTATLQLESITSVTPARKTVELQRVASKVTFSLTVADQTQDGEDTWEPILSGTTIYMVYAMRQASLGAAPTPVPAQADPAFLYEYSPLNLQDSGQRVSRTRKDTDGNPVTVDNLPLYIPVRYDTDGTTVLDKETPFYCYPTSWSTGVATEPYLKLTIPWYNGKRTRKYFYKIPFSGNTLLANHWYQISIDVQVLGGDDADTPPNVQVSYAVADWTNGRTEGTDDVNVSVIPASVVAARYLTVPTTEYIMYNTDRLEIPITSSHDVEVVGFTMKAAAFSADETAAADNYVGQNPRIYNPFTNTLLTTGTLRVASPDYSQATIGRKSTDFTAGQAPETTYGWSVTTSRETVVIQHTLNRNMSTSDYDAVPLTLRLRIRHQTAPGDYYEDVLVEQRPSIVIKPERNEGKTTYGNAFVNGGQNNGENSNNSDGSWTSSSSKKDWNYYLGSAPDGLTGNNKAGSMYIIETSVLPNEGKIGSYMLGDPRTTTVDNLGQSWSQSKGAWEGTSPRRLTYYYPTHYTDSTCNSIIAPRIRIASSHGATQPMTWQDARRRCASYQEDGYPAGRWRIPTKAEIEYIAQLNADNKIELLLGNNDTGKTTDYWCNSGYMTVQYGKKPVYTYVSGTTSEKTNRKYVRCVYDDWYWDETTKDRLPEAQRGTFTWGDISRSAVTLK